MKNYYLAAAILLAACNNSNTATTQETKDTATATERIHTDTSDVKDFTATINTVDDDIEKETANNLIVPGESIGKAAIGTEADSLEVLFGKPGFSDAAMGKAWLTWFGKKPDAHNNKTQLDIYVTYSDTTMQKRSVQQVRTTSSFFKTAEGVHIYSSLDEIKKAFPAIKKIPQSNSDANKFILYDDVHNGISFEIVTANGQQLCLAIFVHIKGKNVRDIYIAAPSE